MVMRWVRIWPQDFIVVREYRRSPALGDIAEDVEYEEIEETENLINDEDN